MYGSKMESYHMAKATINTINGILFSLVNMASMADRVHSDD